MQPTTAMLQAATAAVDLALPMLHPADAILRNFFSTNRALGQRDRAFIAETVFCVLRHKRLLEQLIAQPTARKLVCAALIKLQGRSLGQIEPFLKSSDRDWILDLKIADIETLPAAVRLSLPDWLYDRLVAETSEQDAAAFGRAMLKTAPLDLRVNTLMADREQVLRDLRTSGFDAAPTRYSPVGIRVAGKPAINRHELFCSGAIEVQDEGSQLLGYLVAPKRREMVVDFCAGAGGKTLLMGAMMQSQGRLYAFDVSEKRLKNLAPRLKRSGLSNVHPQIIASENDIKVKRLAGKIDRVLVDAPCSGLGTLRRNPDLKWRQSPQAVDELAAKQCAILASAATLLKPGGRLVYATCSVLAQENRNVIEVFLADHPSFQLVSSGQALDESHIALDCGDYLELCPQLHDTDAFFAAVMQRRA
ncbi:MAG TPA: RsmB/NOP family class I SAM-dependent RNA methyltransferase [Burkholderiales bacterium]|nr:RsmB/NOP family class I SAM-dependent RNA methyltransferase [Burkholderiales bacterium]